MFLGALGGVPEWEGWNGPITQAAVNKRWAEIGRTEPPPVVPAHLVGKYVIQTRSARTFSRTPEFGGWFAPWTKAQGKEVADFLNFWGKVAVDPYRKQSGISKVAGGILQVASVALPAVGIMNAVASAGNVGLQMNAAKGFEKTAESIMSTAYEAQAVRDEAAATQAFQNQMAAIQSLRPTNAAPVVAQVGTGATLVPGWTNGELALAALVGGVLLLGVLQK